MHDVLIEKKVLFENDGLAKANRRSFREKGVFAINMVSGPGAGKTSIIEKSVPVLKRSIKGVAVIEGDIETDLDSRRLARAGIPVRQITTGKTCHLDASMIKRTLSWVNAIEGLRLLIIENVGNMVCPAEYDLGEDVMVAVLSAAEGDDKPLKYPAIFSSSGVLIINKTDLAPYSDFDVVKARKNALSINPGLKVFETSCRTGSGIEEFSAYLAGLVRKEG